MRKNVQMHKKPENTNFDSSLGTISSCVCVCFFFALSVLTRTLHERYSYIREIKGSMNFLA